MRARSVRIAAIAAVALSCAIPVRQEIELGNEYASQLAHQLPLAQDPVLQRTLDEFMQPILAQAVRGELPWRVRLVNSNVVNAFAVPGGHLYVTRGLVEATNRYDELAGVMGHEMGHVDLRHSMRQMERANAAQTTIGIAYVLLGRQPGAAEGAALNVTAGAVFAKFSRDQEREADRAAVQYMTRAGINPEGMIRMFETLQRQSDRQPGAVEQFFASHPMTSDRITGVREAIRTTPGAASTVRNGISERPVFGRLQALVRALPPPPRQASP